MGPTGVVRGGGGGTETVGQTLADSASMVGVAASSTPTPVDGGTTAGVASQYGAVTLVGFVVAALGVLYLWWWLRRTETPPG